MVFLANWSELLKEKISDVENVRFIWHKLIILNITFKRKNPQNSSICCNLRYGDVSSIYYAYEVAESRKFQ